MLLNNPPVTYELFWGTLIILIQLAAILHILIGKRGNPSQCSFWLLVITFLPGAGLIGYLLFGINRYEHVHHAFEQVRDRLDGKKNINAVRELEQLSRYLSKFQLPQEQSLLTRMVTLDRLFPEHCALGGNHLELLWDGTTAYPRMLEDIRKAQKCIRLQSYLLKSDEEGRAFMEALSERAAAGVDVKILFDSVGSMKSYFSNYFRKLLKREHKNFSMKAFSMINLLAPWKFQLRNHRKLLVIDGAIAYVGGMNIANENDRNQKIRSSRYIHDLHCRITGPAVARLNLSFLTDYFYVCRRRKQPQILHEGDCTLPEAAGNAIVRVIPGGPGNTREAARKLFFAAATLATRELWIMTPYFAPGREYVDILCMAAARGVDVRIVVPARSNHLLVDCAGRNFFEQLYDAGVRIYERLGDFSHTKALLVDKQWGFMGSSNCDSRSFSLNFELDFCYDDEAFAEKIAAQFIEEFSKSRKLSEVRLRKTSRLRQLINSLAGLFTPVL